MAGWLWSSSANHLIARSHAETQTVIERTTANTQAILERMDERAVEEAHT